MTIRKSLGKYALAAAGGSVLTLLLQNPVLNDNSIPPVVNNNSMKSKEKRIAQVLENEGYLPFSWSTFDKERTFMVSKYWCKPPQYGAVGHVLGDIKESDGNMIFTVRHTGYGSYPCYQAYVNKNGGEQNRTLVDQAKADAEEPQKIIGILSREGVQIIDPYVNDAVREFMKGKANTSNNRAGN